MKAGRHIIVTGTPGVGKTRFSRILGRRLGILVIDLNRLIKESGCVLRWDRFSRSSVVDIRRTARRVKRVLDEVGGETLIIDSHLAHLVVNPRDVRIGFVLRCHPDVLSKRLKRRGYPESKIAENVLSEILDGCLIEAVERLGRDKIHELDATNVDAYELTDRAVKVFLGKVRGDAFKVDWISDLEMKGKLLKYL